MAEEIDERLALDLGKHAADECMEAIVRICSPAGGRSSVLASMTAFAFILYRIKMTAGAMDKVLPGFTEQMHEGARIIEETEGKDFKQFAEDLRKKRFGF